MRQIFTDGRDLAERERERERERNTFVTDTFPLTNLSNLDVIIREFGRDNRVRLGTVKNVL